MNDPKQAEAGASQIHCHLVITVHVESPTHPFAKKVCHSIFFPRRHGTSACTRGIERAWPQRFPGIVLRPHLQKAGGVEDERDQNETRTRPERDQPGGRIGKKSPEQAARGSELKGNPGWQSDLRRAQPRGLFEMIAGHVCSGVRSGSSICSQLRSSVTRALTVADSSSVRRLLGTRRTTQPLPKRLPLP